MGYWFKVRRSTALTVAVSLMVLVLAAFTGQVQNLIVGAGSGALIAALGLCIVVSYKGSGVVNVAAGAIAMYAGFVYSELVTNGRLIVPPLPDLLGIVDGVGGWFGAGWNLPSPPETVSVGGPLTAGAAILVTVLLGTISGAAIQLVLLRPLRHASPLAKVVVMVGLLITLSAGMTVRYGNLSQSVKPILESRPVEIGSNLTIPLNYILMLGGVVVIAGLLTALFRFTRFGLRTRAAAENEKASVLLGFAPESLATLNWMMSGAISAVVGILAATVNQAIDATTITLLAVPALAAALLGGFNSFGITVLGGVVIGMSQAWVASLGALDWWPKVGNTPLPGLKDLLPLLLIVVVLFVGARSIPERGSLHQVALPSAPEPKYVGRVAVSGSALVVVLLLTVGPAWRLGIINTLIGIMLCASLLVVTGYVGQISLMQLALAGVAAYTLSRFSTAMDIPFPIAPILAIACAVIVGVVAALPAVRIRGVSLAVVTFAGGFAIQQAIFVSPLFMTNGVSSIPPLRIGGNELSINTEWTPSIFGLQKAFGVPDPRFGILCLVGVVVTLFFVINLRHSLVGKRMLAIRSNERAAAAAGINVTTTKLIAFTIGAFIAALAGVTAGYAFGSASIEAFGGLASLALLAFAFLGGISRVSGVIVGGILVAGGIGTVMGIEWFGLGGAYTNYIGGIIVIITAIQNPGGISAAFAGFGKHLALRWGQRRTVSTAG